MVKYVMEMMDWQGSNTHTHTPGSVGGGERLF